MLICNIVIVIKDNVSPDRPPSALGVTLVVFSGSMSGDAPYHIEEGDLIFAKPVQPDGSFCIKKTTR